MLHGRFSQCNMQNVGLVIPAHAHVERSKRAPVMLSVESDLGAKKSAGRA